MKILIILTLLTLLITPQITHARTTPEDILNSQKSSYDQKVKNYSSENKQKLESLSQKIAEINKQKTTELSENMERQSQILDEYIKRNNYEEDGGKDGINRNLSKPIENARYWITYAHEAVAYQAAKVYIFNLTSEKNIRSDSLNLIANLKADLNSTRQKVIKSQNILIQLVQEKKI